MSDKSVIAIPAWATRVEIEVVAGGGAGGNVIEVSESTGDGASGLLYTFWHLNPWASKKPKRELTEDEKGVHRAIGASQTRERNAMGAAQWMDDGE